MFMLGFKLCSFGVRHYSWCSLVAATPTCQVPAGQKNAISRSHFLEDRKKRSSMSKDTRKANAKRIIGLVTVLLSTIILALMLAAFFTPWYGYSSNNTEEMFGGTRPANGGAQTTWDDVGEPHLWNLYLITLVIQCFSILIAAMNLIFVVSAVFLSKVSFRLNLMMKVVRPKLRRGSAVLLFLLSALLILEVSYYTAKHQPMYAVDNRMTCPINEKTGGDPSNNPNAVCYKFNNGDAWGPRAGWKCIVSATVITIVQFLLGVYWVLVASKTAKYVPI
ncbi:hypothetical protein PROFUN_06705 [Planoprotostelium fungivorum]|uniref:Uncharacterized protein n=1 Tax=Planoprotostelium fungivorum TaxID=1890364 RepID=A0A2P6NG44_9EUKA|nr:hypothetical protein PROFUN_06705 [Planoprotostelium fungivorum]